MAGRVHLDQTAICAADGISTQPGIYNTRHRGEYRIIEHHHRRSAAPVAVLLYAHPAQIHGIGKPVVDYSLHLIAKQLRIRIAETVNALLFITDYKVVATMAETLKNKRLKIFPLHH